MSTVEYTVVFSGHPRNIKGSPFDVKSDFGVVQAIAAYNSMEDADRFRQALEEIADGPFQAAAEIAQAALDERDAALTANLKAGQP